MKDVDSVTVLSVEHNNIMIMPQKYNFILTRDGSINIESKSFISLNNTGELELQYIYLKIVHINLKIKRKLQ